MKPGQCFAVYEWCITDHYDPNNATHKRIKDEIELGNGLPDIRRTHQCLQAVKDAGFEVRQMLHFPLFSDYILVQFTCCKYTIDKAMYYSYFFLLDMM